MSACHAKSCLARDAGPHPAAAVHVPARATLC